MEFSRHTVKMMSKRERTVVPLLHKNGHLHARHEELSMCMCVCARLLNHAFAEQITLAISNEFTVKIIHANHFSEVFFVILNNK